MNDIKDDSVKKQVEEALARREEGRRKSPQKAGDG